MTPMEQLSFEAVYPQVYARYRNAYGILPSDEELLMNAARVAIFEYAKLDPEDVRRAHRARMELLPHLNGDPWFEESANVLRAVHETVEELLANKDSKEVTRLREPE